MASRVYEQPITARLAGAGSLRRELEALLAAAPANAQAEDFRNLLVNENAAGKASANARMWMWKRLKLRYALDAPTSPEFRAFRWAMARAVDPADRGLIAALMMARTDRLFREVVTNSLANTFGARGLVVDAKIVRTAVEQEMRAAGLEWSAKSIANISNHVLSSLKDFGVVEGSRERRTTEVRLTSVVATFAAMLGRAEGLTDRQILDSAWFQFLGAGHADAVAALHSAATAGLLRFRMQADVVELHLPELGTAA